MNIPNILTLSRIVLAVVLIFLLEENSTTGTIWAAIVFVVASLTDFCDGHMAKTRGLVSDFGKIMDPVADKVLLLSAFGVLAHIGMIAWWIFIVIAIREILVTISRFLAMHQGHVLAAERAGKIKTVIQIIAVLAILFYLVAQQTESHWFYHVQRPWQSINQGLSLAAVILTVYSGIEYFRNKSKLFPS
jgi:CDP-diacylglycerol--glycerol-3-phosphate 3-phosphatidyltransferase